MDKKKLYDTYYEIIKAIDLTSLTTLVDKINNIDLRSLDTSVNWESFSKIILDEKISELKTKISTIQNEVTNLNNIKKLISDLKVKLKTYNFLYYKITNLKKPENLKEGATEEEEKQYNNALGLYNISIRAQKDLNSLVPKIEAILSELKNINFGGITTNVNTGITELDPMRKTEGMKELGPNEPRTFISSSGDEYGGRSGTFGYLDATSKTWSDFAHTAGIVQDNTAGLTMNDARDEFERKYILAGMMSNQYKNDFILFSEDQWGSKDVETSYGAGLFIDALYNHDAALSNTDLSKGNILTELKDASENVTGYKLVHQTSDRVLTYTTDLSGNITKESEVRK